MAQKAENKSLKINHKIMAQDVRLILETGEDAGVVSKEDALRKAEDAGLDLVEISPQMTPPVCKLLDYGKHLYDLQKKKSLLKKKQKKVQIKEMQLRPAIGDHDYQVKLKNVRKFLDDGDKVRVILQFRGREMSHQEIGIALLDRVQKDTEDLGKVEFAPKFEGRRVNMVLAPKTT